MKRNKPKRRTIAHDIFGEPEVQPINQKQKGNTNEREAAAWLKEWTGKPFVRTPSSGGMRLLSAKNFCGDVVCADDTYHFCFSVETKHLKDLHVTKVLRANSEIYTIWQQAVADAHRASKHPMLLLRQNGMPKRTYYCFVADSVAIPIRLAGGEHISKGVGIVGFSSDSLLRIPNVLDLLATIQNITFEA